MRHGQGGRWILYNLTIAIVLMTIASTFSICQTHARGSISALNAKTAPLDVSSGSLRITQTVTLAETLLLDSPGSKFALCQTCGTTAGASHAGRGSGFLYAESDDGVSWYKPSLNKTVWKGSTANNLIENSGMTTGIYLDLDTTDPSQRYKIATGTNGAGAAGVCAAGVCAAGAPGSAASSAVLAW